MKSRRELRRFVESRTIDLREFWKDRRGTLELDESLLASIIKQLRRSEARRAASNARIILEIFEPRHPRRQLFLVLVKSPRTSIFVAKCPDICSMTGKSILSVCRLQFS